MILSKQPKIFDNFFIGILECKSNFFKKDEPHSSPICDIIGSERSCYLNVLKTII